MPTLSRVSGLDTNSPSHPPPPPHTTPSLPHLASLFPSPFFPGLRFLVSTEKEGEIPFSRAHSRVTSHLVPKIPSPFICPCWIRAAILILCEGHGDQQVPAPSSVPSLPQETEPQGHTRTGPFLVPSPPGIKNSAGFLGSINI